MSVNRFSPDDPREWLNRAKSNLAKAQHAVNAPDVYLEDLCFDAQQAAEKAIKAVLIQLNVKFPYTHDIARLLLLVEQAGEDIPSVIKEAVILSDYAVQTRYPGFSEPVVSEEYENALIIADAVISWAQYIIDLLLHNGN